MSLLQILGPEANGDAYPSVILTEGIIANLRLGKELFVPSLSIPVSANEEKKSFVTLSLVTA